MKAAIGLIILVIDYSDNQLSGLKKLAHSTHFSFNHIRLFHIRVHYKIQIRI